MHYLTVTANDGAKRGTERMATATVTILVQVSAKKSILQSTGKH